MNHRFELAEGRAVELKLEDCLQGLAGMEPGSVDVVVTSPPYNIGARYTRYRDDIPRQEYLDWSGTWIAAVARVLSPKGSLFLNLGGIPSDPWIPLDVAARAREHLQLQNVIHWIKSIAISAEDMGRYPGRPDGLAVGHYKPINSPRYVNDAHEYIFHLTPGGDTPLDRLAIGVPYTDKSNVARWKAAGKDRRCRGNTWFLPYRTIKSRDRDRPHPATFPKDLPERCLKLHGLERVRMALDPFVGLGSTAIACAGLGLPFIGYEIDEQYLEQAAARVEACLAGPLQPELTTR